uniref:GDP-mannose transporter n=1 Tax=Solanum tuberosum TaxID=4113 RepID=M1D393_SOLTU
MLCTTCCPFFPPNSRFLCCSLSAELFPKNYLVGHKPSIYPYVCSVSCAITNSFVLLSSRIVVQLVAVISQVNTVSLHIEDFATCIFICRPLLQLPTFWLVTTFSGLLGLAISFTSMWFLHQTSATTYSLVGSLNKIPLSVAGIFLFHVSTSLENSASILFGLLAGVFFARAKMQDKSQTRS